MEITTQENKVILSLISKEDQDISKSLSSLGKLYSKMIIMFFETHFPALDVTTETEHKHSVLWSVCSGMVAMATCHMWSIGLSSWNRIAVHSMSNTMTAFVFLPTHIIQLYNIQPLMYVGLRIDPDM